MTWCVECAIDVMMTYRYEFDWCRMSVMLTLTALYYLLSGHCEGRLVRYDFMSGCLLMNLRLVK